MYQFLPLTLYLVPVPLGVEEITKLGLWGNYSIPKDNPYAEDKELQPEIWALGMRNPWRCSFDSARPSYFMCADVGQVKYMSFTLQECDLLNLVSNRCILTLYSQAFYDCFIG